MGHTDRPVNAVVPEIEDVFQNRGKAIAAERLLDALGEDYNESTPAEEVNRRNWFGRCVWECDNDVCDDQTVTIEWDDDPLPLSHHDQNGAQLATQVEPGSALNRRAAKTVQFHMVALTDAISARRGRICGTAGEIAYDSTTIRVTDFRSGKETVYATPQKGDGHDGHGGGDDGLALAFARAVGKVKSGEMGAKEAQRALLGCTAEELLRSHAAVFWAEDARRKGAVLEWGEWWGREVEQKLREMGVEVRE